MLSLHCIQPLRQALYAWCAPTQPAQRARRATANDAADSAADDAAADCAEADATPVDPIDRSCGWFDSSHALQHGLCVLEHASADTLATELPLGSWLELQLVDWRPALAS